MKRLSQRDPKWADIKIGNSKSTVGGHGCLITSLCMLIDKFGGVYNPDRAATHWKFTSVPGDTDPKYLVWKQPFLNMGFVWRGFGYCPGCLIEDPVTKEKDTTLNILRKYASDPDYGVVLQVLTWKGGQHWLAAEGKAILGWAANDPWDAKRLWAAPLPYRRIIGWALLKRL